MPKPDKSDSDEDLEALQVALVRYQQHAIKTGLRDLIIFEGRDAAGKDGAIKRITEFLSVRNTRVAALPKPTEREQGQWYFQRYAAHLPAAGEIVLFNRSWYNRGGVEPVMGFCKPDQHQAFLADAPVFERMLTDSGVRLIKFWLDISRSEQAQRLTDRATDPLKALKVSPLDAVAQEKWEAYSAARNEMLARTHSAPAPWTVVHTDKKPRARENIIRHILHALAPPEIAGAVPKPDPDVLFTFDPAALTDGRLEA